MKQYKISTIIPVYNSGIYLQKCFESIMKQSIDFENIQLIIINDGSTDNSEKIIHHFLDKFENIVYLKKENGGQSSARNLGLKTAIGEYISFVDSDDWIEPEMYKELYETAVKNQLDIVTCDYTKFKKNKNHYVSSRFTNDEVKNFIIMNVGPCNMIIKKTLLDSRKFTFPTGIIYEDLASIPALALNNTKIKLVEKSFYNYLIHNNSSMNQPNYNSKLDDVFVAFNLLKAQFQHFDNIKQFDNELEFLYIRRLLMSASLRYIKFNDPKKKLNQISLIIKENFPNWKQNEYYKMLPFKQRLIGILAYKKRKKLLKALKNINDFIHGN